MAMGNFWKHFEEIQVQVLKRYFPDWTAWQESLICVEKLIDIQKSGQKRAENGGMTILKLKKQISLWLVKIS